MDRVRGLILIAVALFLLVGCRNGKQSDKPAVTVSIPPQEYLFRQIAGNDIDVNTILAPGANPETYEPSIQAMRRLEESREYAMVGTLPFEQALHRKLKEMYPKLNVTDARNHLFMLSEVGTHHHNHAHEGHEDHHHDHAEDPHVWTTPHNIQAMADALLEVAIRTNPAHEALYRQRHKALSQRISALNTTMLRSLSALKGRKVVIWHPSLAYMAHDFGFSQLAVQQGHKEPSPRQMAQALDSARNARAVAFVVEKEHSPRMAMTLNNEIGIPMVRTSLMQPDIINSLTHLALDLEHAAKSLQ